MSDHTPQDAGTEGETIPDAGDEMILRLSLGWLASGAHDKAERRLGLAITELVALRAERARHAAVVAAARVYLAPDTGAIPACTAKTPYGQLLQAMREFDGEGGDA